MANTRIGNDQCRIIKQNEQSTGPGRWISDVPGPGSNAPYVADPHIRIQHWAGNTWTNSMQIQNRFMRGMATTPRDCITHKAIENNCIPSVSRPIKVSTSRTLTTEQSRAICPAWTLKGLENSQWIEPVAPILVSNPFTPQIDGRDLSKKEWTHKNMCPWNNNAGLHT